MKKAWRSKMIAPFIYPLYPKRAGKLRMAIDLGKFFQYDVASRYTGPLKIDIVTWCDGELLSAEQFVVMVKDAVPDRQVLLNAREGLDDKLAFLELTISAESEIFDRPLFENNFGLLRRAGYGAVAITDTPKFSDTRIIEQIREIGAYCMTHTGVGVDRCTGYGNFFLLINPYEQALVVRLNSMSGLQITKKIAAHTAENVSLEPLLGNDRWGTVMLTAKQRILIYDVKAPVDDPMMPISLDHLDAFRGELAMKPATAKEFSKHIAKRAFRRLGMESPVR